MGGGEEDPHQGEGTEKQGVASERRSHVPPVPGWGHQSKNQVLQHRQGLVNGEGAERCRDLPARCLHFIYEVPTPHPHPLLREKPSESRSHRVVCTHGNLGELLTRLSMSHLLEVTSQAFLFYRL